MNEIELAFLQACQEYANRQREMLPQLALALGLEESRVFYTWMLQRFPQRGRLPDSEWKYFFHGCECDLKNVGDGRFLRMDFGPKGRVGILDPFGILRFVMTSVAPWPEFTRLKTHFAKHDAPFNENSGAAEKVIPIWNELEERGLVEHADPGLMALEAQCTTRGQDGLNYLKLPDDFTDEQRADCVVARRFQLSPKAYEILRSSEMNGTHEAPSLPKSNTLNAV